MVSSLSRGCSPSNWAKWLIYRGYSLLTDCHDPPSRDHRWFCFFETFLKVENIWLMGKLMMLHISSWKIGIDHADNSECAILLRNMDRCYGWLFSPSNQRSPLQNVLPLLPKKHILFHSSHNFFRMYATLSFIEKKQPKAPKDASWRQTFCEIRELHVQMIDWVSK